MNAEQLPPEEASLVGRALTRLVLAACRFRWPVLAGTLVLCAASLYLACTRLEYHTRRSDLVSPRKEYQQLWQKYLDEFGDDDDMVVVVQGTDRPRMRAGLDALAAEIRKQPARFDRLFYRADLGPLRDRALLYLPSSQIEQIQANLVNMSMLLEFPSVSWQSLNLISLLYEARQRAGRINPDQPLAPSDEQFLTQLLAISQSAAAVLADPAAYRNPWGSLLAQPPEQKDLLAEPQYFFSDDGTLAFLLVRPVQEAGSFTPARQGVEALRGVVAAVGPRFPDLKFGLTGLPVLEDDEMTASQADTRLASWLALAGVALLYLVVYRGIRYPLLTVSTLLVGTVLALGWLTLTVGHLNILSATFAVMLIGLGDYGVLWVARYEQERAASPNLHRALRRTAASAGTSILTAALTTALAFYAAMLADFRAVAELGWIAGTGVLFCALSCFTVLPALLTICDGRRGPTKSKNILPLTTHHSPLTTHHSPLTTHALWLPWLTRRPRWVLTVGATATAVLAVFAFRVEYDHNLLHMQARDLDSVKWELTLIEHTKGASWHALSWTDTPEQALALKARYEELPGVGFVVEVASLVPAEQQRKVGLLRDIQQRLQKLPKRGVVIAHARPSVPKLKTALAILIGQLQPLADVSPQPLLTRLRRGLMTLADRLAEMPVGYLAEQRLQQFEQRLTGDLAEDLHRLRDVSTPAAITLADLPAELRERYVGQSGKWLLRVFGKDCLWDYGPLENFVTQIRTVDPEATGKPFATLEGLRAMKHGFLMAGLYALLAIVLVLLIDFRNVGHVLLALAPLGMGMVLALGIMGLTGMPLNPANMIALPLILGVGVDNGVHVLHDYLSRRNCRRYALGYATGKGILVAALTTMLGFGTLMLSRHRGLVGLGLILTLGVGCCMLSALVFLPAVLRLRSRSRHRARQGEPVIKPFRRAA